MPVANRNPTNEPSAAINAFLPPSFPVNSPIKAPKNGPIITPTNGMKIPATSPMVAPHTPLFVPPNFFVAHAGII